MRQSSVSPGSAESKAATTKGKEKVEQSMIGFDAGHSSSDESLDEELGIPRLNTPGVKKMQGGEGVRRSTRVKYLVERLRYDNLTFASLCIHGKCDTGTRTHMFQGCYWKT